MCVGTAEAVKLFGLGLPVLWLGPSALIPVARGQDERQVRNLRRPARLLLLWLGPGGLILAACGQEWSVGSGLERWVRTRALGRRFSALVWA